MELTLNNVSFEHISLPQWRLPEGAKKVYVESHYPSTQQLNCWQQCWVNIQHNHNLSTNNNDERENKEVAWLIDVFNHVFHWQNVQLIKGQTEPEYLPATMNTPAQIIFAHGYFSSALHEISHWCMAGKHRRTLTDYGYWYAPDGRSEQQQHLFEQVEIKPQAIECLLTCACTKSFHTSKDNLDASFNTNISTFDQDVYYQIQLYLKMPQLLPKDALLLLHVLQEVCR